MGSKTHQYIFCPGRGEVPKCCMWLLTVSNSLKPIIVYNPLFSLPASEHLNLCVS